MKRHRRKPFAKLLKAVILQLMLLTLIIVSVRELYDTIHDNMEIKDQHTAAVTPAVNSHAIDSDVGNRDTDKTDTNDINASNNDTGTIDAENETTASDIALLQDDQLLSSNAVLVRLSDEKLLFEKDSKEYVYPASLTKIMTAIVAIENIDDLDIEITLQDEIFPKLYDEDASLAGFLPGETVPALDLLYGVLLPSGAECCAGLSDYIAGSEADFVALLNQKAKELGMDQTHFTNSTGLNDSDHYTTVADLAVLLEYALKNKTFYKIFTTSRYTTSPTKLHPDGITLYSTMFKSMESDGIDNHCILGGKTGYTSEAGLCLASLAKINDTRYILITTGAKGDHNTEQYNIEDAIFVYSHLE